MRFRRYRQRTFTNLTNGSREGAELDPFEYIECVYNRVRTHSALGYMSPAEFEGRNWSREGAAPLEAGK